MKVEIELKDIKSFFNKTMLFWNLNINEYIVISHQEYIDIISKYLENSKVLESIDHTTSHEEIIFIYNGLPLSVYISYMNELLYRERNLENFNFIIDFEETKDKLENYEKKLEEYGKNLIKKSEILKKNNFDKRIIISEYQEWGIEHSLQSLQRVLSILDSHINLDNFFSLRDALIMSKTHIIGYIISRYQKNNNLDDYPFHHIGENVHKNLKKLNFLLIKDEDSYGTLLEEIFKENIKRNLKGFTLYLYFFQVFTLMLDSPFLDKADYDNLNILYKFFYESMYDCEIVYIDVANNFFNETIEIEKRKRQDNTTRLTIIFVRNEINVYKMRLDLPHAGQSTPHINFGNACVDEFVFISKEEEQDLRNKLKDEEFKELFIFTFDFHLYSFRRKFSEEEIIKAYSENKDLIWGIYNKNSHLYINMPIFTQENIFSFLEDGLKMLNYNNYMNFRDFEVEKKELLLLEAYKEFQFCLQAFLLFQNEEFNFDVLDIDKKYIQDTLKSCAIKVYNYDCDEKIVNDFVDLMLYLDFEQKKMTKIENLFVDINNYFEKKLNTI